MEWRASGAETTFAPKPPQQILAEHPSEDAENLSAADRPATALPLRPGQILPLPNLQRLRLVLHTDDTDVDPVAFLLTDHGTVRSDADMVFYGQPDHPSRAITLASDDSGASTALHVTFDSTPDTVTEILLTAQLPVESTTATVRLQVLDLDTGSDLGHLDLPSPGPTGLLQLGALHRGTSHWSLQMQPDALDIDLAALATAAGVEIG